LHVSAIAISINDPFGNTRIGNLVFKQGIGQLETLMFVGVRLEDTFDLAGVVFAKPAPLV